jgi:hypothetical protein
MYFCVEKLILNDREIHALENVLSEGIWNCKYLKNKSLWKAVNGEIQATVPWKSGGSVTTVPATYTERSVEVCVGTWTKPLSREVLNTVSSGCEIIGDCGEWLARLTRPLLLTTTTDWSWHFDAAHQSHILVWSLGTHGCPFLIDCSWIVAMAPLKLFALNHPHLWWRRLSISRQAAWAIIEPNLKKPGAARCAVTNAGWRNAEISGRICSRVSGWCSAN